MLAPEIRAEPLYLSRLYLNLRSRDVRADLADSQKLHRRILAAYPTSTRKASGLLFRIDPMGESLLDGSVLLAQSMVAPDWSLLPSDYIVPSDFGMDLDGDVPWKEISASYNAIRAGNLFRFRLRANPTKRIPWNVFAEQNPSAAARFERENRRFTSPRIPVTVLTGKDLEKPENERPSAKDKLHEWLVRKGQAQGFIVADLLIRPDPLTGDMQRGNKRADNSDGIVTIAHKATVYEGVLKVTDLPLFQIALRQGVGGGKAYGFGLLSIRRL